jgi:ribosomal protein S18 acetylase RimI-like enzyme
MLYRTAHLTESLDVARFIRVAGGGLYEFLFDDLVPLLSADELLAIAIASDNDPVSYRNCHVAIDEGSGNILGTANAFPADLLRDPSYGLLPSERAEHIRPMLRLQDWGSMFLNALAVDDQYRGRGIGSCLLDWALAHARELGLPRLSLHVWADNFAAREYYRARGFIDIGVADIALHPRLPHQGGSVLMSRSLTGTV